MRNHASVPGENRPQARQQEHASFHHGGRVQVGGHRCRRSHRVRQPEVERKLGRLGERACEDQEQRGEVQRRGAHQIAAAQDFGEFVRSGDVPEKKKPGEQDEPAAAGHDKSHAGTLPPLGQVAPKSDQQKGREAGQLPENREKKDVVAYNDADHRALKQQQVREKTGRPAPQGRDMSGRRL
jgi:hypothetical protein